MKAITKINRLILTYLISIIGSIVGFFWTIIEFILHLVKDKDFNWVSFWLFILSIVVFISFTLYLIYLGYKSTKKQSKKINSTKSKFRQKLDDAMRKATEQHKINKSKI